MPMAERNLADATARATERALAGGALVPFDVTSLKVDDGPCPYRIEWASSLARKDQAAIPKPGAKLGAFNPFLPYDPALYVADLGPSHVLLLNKFPVAFGHVLVVTRDYAEQEQKLETDDLSALALAMQSIDGLAFFNGGPVAGASVRHRHLQIAPFSAPLIEALLDGAKADGLVQTLAALPFRHAFVRYTGEAADAAAAGRRLQQAYLACLAHCGLQADADGRLPAYNLLATRGWLLLVPRRCETWQEAGIAVSLNAMSFAGSIFVREASLIPLIREAGLMCVLSSVTFPSAQATT
ncbi:MAG: phosphorylase [Solimonas sp.]